MKSNDRIQQIYFPFSKEILIYFCLSFSGNLSSVWRNFGLCYPWLQGFFLFCDHCHVVYDKHSWEVYLDECIRLAVQILMSFKKREERSGKQKNRFVFLFVAYICILLCFFFLFLIETQCETPPASWPVLDTYSGTASEENL